MQGEYLSMYHECSPCFILGHDFLYRGLYRIPLLFGPFGNLNPKFMTRFSKIRYSLVFNRKDQLNSYGQALIQIRAYQDKKSRYFSTGIYIEPKYWDQRNKKIKHNHPTQFVYNKQILQQMQEMEAFEIKMINQLGSFPIDRIEEYKSHSSYDQTQSFLTFFEDELSKSSMKPGALKMYKLTLRKWQEFKKNIFFQDLSYKLVVGFDRYLRQQGLSLNTIKKHHNRTHTYIKHAIRQNLVRIDDNPYKTFVAKGVEPDRGFLSIEELEKIETLTFVEEEQYLERIKDIFLLACYTGMRFGDVVKITAGDVSLSNNGLLLYLKAEKTVKRLDLPLYYLFRKSDQTLSRPESIIQRYLDQYAPVLNEPGMEQIPLFKVSNQYLNRSLKVVAKRAGINKQVTSHFGRRTFATIMARKVQAPVLQRLLQHSRPDMTNIYIQLSNKAIEDELEKIEWN